MRRWGLVLAVLAALGLPVGLDTSATAPTTISCAQTWSSFNVQLVGDRNWEDQNLNELGSIGVPAEKAIIVVWSRGGTIEGGLSVHSWSSAVQSWSSPRCKVVKATLKPPSLTRLGPPIRVKDGWAFGRKFTCLDPGRLLITTTRHAAGAKVVVRLKSGGKVIAVGEVAKGGGWIRGSTSCEDREK